MRPHLHLLMRPDTQPRARLSSAQQDVSGSAVFGKIISRIRGIKLARRRQLPGASEAATLMADRRQLDALRLGRIPDVLVVSDFNGNFAVGRDERDWIFRRHPSILNWLTD